MTMKVQENVKDADRECCYPTLGLLTFVFVDLALGKGTNFFSELTGQGKGVMRDDLHD